MKSTDEAGPRPPRVPRGGKTRGQTTGKDPLRETSRDYAHPHRPALLRFYNAVGKAGRRLGIQKKLDPEEIVRAAERAAGAPEGDRSYREGLEVLVNAVETEANLHSFGRLVTRTRLVGTLRSRFRAESLLREKPSILDRPLAPPLIITGLQRTGTTFLHRLIAADRRFRSLRSWEVVDPAPPPGLRPGAVDPRARSARTAVNATRWMAPDFFAVHPLELESPEEDVLLLDLTLQSTVAEAIVRVPSYAAWVERTDAREAYGFLRKLLLLFQAEEERPFWILKTPHHLEFLDDLLAVFPEAKVIQTHRDPGKTMGSFLSMIAHAWGMFTDTVDVDEVSRHWYRKCRRMVDRGMASRSALPKEVETDRFLDIQFRDLVDDPLGTLERIYAFAGVEFDNRARVEAEIFLRDNGRHRYGRHVYDLADFSLTADGVRADFADYRERYAIPLED